MVSCTGCAMSLRAMEAMTSDLAACPEDGAGRNIRLPRSALGTTGISTRAYCTVASYRVRSGLNRSRGRRGNVIFAHCDPTRF